MAVDIKGFVKFRTLRADGGWALIRVDTISGIVESKDKDKPIILLLLQNSNPLRLQGESIETVLSKMSQAAARDYIVITDPSPEAARFVIAEAAE